MPADDYCYLTTTGRRSGTPHRIEIWYARSPDRGDTLYLLAGGGRSSDWVQNLEADPTAATVEVDGVTHPATARLLDDDSVDTDEEEAEARRLVFDKYQSRYGGDLTDWRERSLPVALTIIETPEV